MIAALLTDTALHLMDHPLTRPLGDWLLSWVAGWDYRDWVDVPDGGEAPF